MYLINPVPAYSRSKSGNEPEQETTGTNLVTTTSKNIPIPDCLKEDKGCAIDPTGLVEDPFSALQEGDIFRFLVVSISQG